MLLRCTSLLLVSAVTGLQISAPVGQQDTCSRFSRRSAIAQGAAALVATSVFALEPAAAMDAKAKDLVLKTSADLKLLLEDLPAFVDGLAKGDGSAPKLPAAIPFTTFQKLEQDAEPEFMEAAIDYAEAFRNAKDLVKLAKLTKEEVQISKKEAGKPRMTETKEYGELGGLASTESYAQRAGDELLGASLALESAVKALR